MLKYAFHCEKYDSLKKDFEINQYAEWLFYPYVFNNSKLFTIIQR